MGTLAFHASHLLPELVACRIGDNMTAAAHLVLDVGSPISPGFVAADEAVGAASDAALATYDEAHATKTKLLILLDGADDFGARPTSGHGC